MPHIKDLAWLTQKCDISLIYIHRTCMIDFTLKFNVKRSVQLKYKANTPPNSSLTANSKIRLLRQREPYVASLNIVQERVQLYFLPASL